MIVFRAPDDCLQYYTGSSGEFKSFNFANGIQRSLTIIFPYQSYPIMKIWANLDLDFLQANCSPARPTESASDKSLVSNFFHKKHRLSPKDTKKIMSWHFFRLLCYQLPGKPFSIWLLWDAHLWEKNLLVSTMVSLWFLSQPTYWTSSCPTWWVSSPSWSCLQQTL